MDETGLLWMRNAGYGCKKPVMDENVHVMDETELFMDENVTFFELWIKRSFYG